MQDAVPFILRALQSAFGIYGATYLVTAIVAPSWFLEHVSINHLDRRRGRRAENRSMSAGPSPWWAMPLAFLTMIAVGVVIYAASYATIAVIPYSWGSLDEDGDWTSVRAMLQMGAALVGSIGLSTRVEIVAESLITAPVERDARLSLIELIGQRRSYGDRSIPTPKALDQDAALHPIDYATEYRRNVARRIVDALK